MLQNLDKYRRILYANFWIVFDTFPSPVEQIISSFLNGQKIS